MSIKARLSKLEAEAGSGDDGLCACPVDPNETWETCPPEVLAAEWAENKCRKCGKPKKTEIDRADWALRVVKAYGTEEELRQLQQELT